MPKTRDDFLPDFGGFLDGVPGDIIDANFAVASGDYADKAMATGTTDDLPIMLQLTIESPNLDKPAIQGFSIGKQEQWEIQDNGKTLVNKKNPDKHTFRDSSMAMALVKAMAEAMGNGNIEKGQDMFAKRDHYMTEAAFYTGLSFDWEVKVITRDIGGKQVTSKPPLPVNFLGETAVKTASKPAEAPAGNKTVANTGDLDKILISNSAGKTEKELKAFAVKDTAIKSDKDYLKAVISGAKLKELEEAGSLIKDPDTDTYMDLG